MAENPNSGLPIQPLEVSDFSGGITDFHVAGDIKRARICDNFLISVDKVLETREGSTCYGGLDQDIHLLGRRQRVDKFIYNSNDNDLLVNQGREIQYLSSSPVWTTPDGVAGNEPLGAGDAYHSVSYSEWNQQIYITSDAGCIPTKMYKNEAGTYVFKTAGLPTPEVTPEYTYASLLAACITLANDLRSKMVAHFADTFVHTAADTTNGTSIANAATTEATLYTLIPTLCTAYDGHAKVMAAGGFTDGFHKSINYYFQGNYNSTVTPKGPYEPIKSKKNISVIDESLQPLTEAATVLNELRKKWIWHVLALFTHDATNTYVNMAINLPTAPKIDVARIKGIPTITPNYADVINYANTLKTVFNNHLTGSTIGIANTTQHTQSQHTSNYQTCTLPDATDLDSAELLIFWIWKLYGALHIQDAVRNPIHTLFTFSSTAGSANITSVVSGGANLELLVGDFVVINYHASNYFNDVNGNNWIAQVTASASGTATLSKTVSYTGSSIQANTSGSYYHSSYQFAGDRYYVKDTQFTEVDDNEILEDITNEVLPQTTQAWIDLAATVYQALAVHVRNIPLHNKKRQISQLISSATTYFYKPSVENVSYAFVYQDTYNIQNGVEIQTKSGVLVTDPIETGKIPESGVNLETGIDEIDNPDFDLIIEQTFGTPITDYDVYQKYVAPVILKYTGTQNISISNLPVLTNTLNTNYDTSNIKLEIYRTINNGTVYYLEDEVANGTTTYTDRYVSSDGSDPLDTKETIYTTGGEVESIQTLPCRYLHILNGFTFTGYITDEGQVFKNRVIQSKPNVPDGGPPDFYTDLEDEIIGISSTKNNVIVFCKQSIYRLSGGYTLTGSGLLTQEKITDKLGCVSTNSIVQTEAGLFFAGTDGFYYTDGYQVIKISIDLDATYKSLTQSDTQAKRIYGAYDRTNRRIWWTVQRSTTATDCDMCYIFHLNYGIKPSGAFTTASNGNHFRPSALHFDNITSNMIRGDMRGLVFRHSKEYLSDPKIPSTLSDISSVSFADWQKVYIPWNYTTCSSIYGSTFKGQFATKVHVMGENSGNSNIQINTYVENKLNELDKRPLAPIKYEENIRWGDARQNWGDDDDIWQYGGSLDFWRRFSSGTLRSSLRALEFTPARVGIYRYDDFPELSYVTVDSTAKTAVIQTPSGYTDIIWPLDVVDMYIAFDDDDYDTEFLITAVSSATITFSDASNLSANQSSGKWVIRGYQKEAAFTLNSYTVHFAQIGSRGRAYTGVASRGENV